MELLLSFRHFMTFIRFIHLKNLSFHHYGLILILAVEMAIPFIGKQPLQPLEREQLLKLGNYFACRALPSIHPLCSLLHGIMQEFSLATLR